MMDNKGKEGVLVKWSNIDLCQGGWYGYMVITREGTCMFAKSIFMSGGVNTNNVMYTGVSVQREYTCYSTSSGCVRITRSYIVLVRVIGYACEYL
jgi:hypothetical protein